MRCVGLTDDRRRCSEQAVAGSGYCSAHQPQAQVPIARVTSAARGLERITARLRKPLGVPPVPDPGKYSVPGKLSESATPEVIDHLLHHVDSTMRWSAAFVLRKRRDPSAIEPLWQVLLHDSSRMTRQQAAVALGKIGTPEVQGPLVEGLWHDPDAGVRQACAVALGNLGYVPVARELALALEREHDHFVRWDIVLALGQLGDPRDEPLLSRIAKEEKSPFVRAACHEAIEAIRRRHSA